jgi:hypothetical protein
VADFLAAGEASLKTFNSSPFDAVSAVTHREGAPLLAR